MVQASNGLVMVAECKLGLEDMAQPQALNYYHKIWSHSFPNKLGQSFAPTFILELMGASLRYGLGNYAHPFAKPVQLQQQCSNVGHSRPRLVLYMRSNQDVMLHAKTIM